MTVDRSGGGGQAIRVLVVDDSAVMRALIARKLERETDIEVVASAADAMEARALIKQTDPDVVTLDIEMPGMDGLAFLEKIMELRPTPVVIVSGATQSGAQATARALRLGAINCYAKSGDGRSLAGDDGGELARLVREAARVDFGKRVASAPPAVSSASPPQSRPHRPAATPPEIIAIGASTGGVEALHTLLAGFPADCPPTLIVQHVAECFAPALVKALDETAAPRVMLAQSDLPLERGTVLVAPGDDRHLALAGAGSLGYRVVLRPGDPVSGHRPSVDRLFASVARTAGAAASGIILTGMGRDGAKGLLAMNRAGARTIAQDEASCVVFGMPRAAIDLGAAQDVLPLSRIAPAIFAATGQSA